MSKLKISDGTLTLPADTVTQTLLVLGGKGMGKTNFAAVLAEELAAARHKFSWIDPMGVAWGLRHSAEEELSRQHLDALAKVANFLSEHHADNQYFIQKLAAEKLLSPTQMPRDTSRTDSKSRPDPAAHLHQVPISHGRKRAGIAGNLSFWKDPEPAANSNGSGELQPGERKLLTALAQFGATRRSELSIVTAYKRATRNQYIAKLVQKGYAQTAGDSVEATIAGIATLGSYEALPTGRKLFEHWRQKLTGRERSILVYLVESARGEAIEREALDEPTGCARATRNQYLRLLAGRRLVEFTGPGTVKAAPALFGE